MKVELVSHCWNYGRLLTFQLSSIYLYPPRDVDLTCTVFYASDDLNTVRVLDFFHSLSWPDKVRLRRWPLPMPRLTRRAIGRNLAALATRADWVWFTDCDHLFREGTFDTLPGQVATVDNVLVYPRITWLQHNHAAGDRLIEQLSHGPRVIDVDPREFRQTRNRRAIGGVQIARGDVLRAQGYCRERSERLRPSNRWTRCVEDQTFRHTLKTSGTSIALPGVYRIRHSVAGRQKEGVVL